MAVRRSPRCRRTRSASFAALAFISGSLASSPALANGRYPAADQLLVSPRDSRTLALRTTFGLLLSEDDGVSFRWICERAIGLTGIEDPAFVLTKNGTMVAGLYKGLSSTSDNGCSWRFDEGLLANARIIDTVRRTATDEVLALVAGAGDGGANGDFIARSADGRSPWSTLGAALRTGAITDTVEVAASDPDVLYVSARTSSSQDAESALFVSHDRGATWDERPIPIEKGETAYVSAVAPTNSSRVYVRTLGASLSRLLVTDDGGTTFRESYRAAKPLLGFALSPDGAVVYLGSSEGLVAAPTNTLLFETRATFGVRCLAAESDRVYACASESGSGFILGRSTDGGRTFAPLLRLAGLSGPIQCSARDAGANVCRDEWPALRELLGGSAEVTDAGTDADAEGPSDEMMGGGSACSTPGGSNGASLVLLGLGLFGTGLWARRRRRAPRPPAR